MVGIFKALLPSLFLATFAVAQGFKIFAPSSKIWWGALHFIIISFNAGAFNSHTHLFFPIFFILVTVGNSENEFDWDCNSPEAQADQQRTGGTFTVRCVLSIIFSTLNLQLKHISMFHPDFAGPIAIIAQQPNADCNKSISIDQSNQKPGTNYTIYLANPLNNSQVSLVFSFLYSLPKLTHFRSSLPLNHSRSNPLDQSILARSLPALRLPVVLLQHHHQPQPPPGLVMQHLVRIAQAFSD